MKALILILLIAIVAVGQQRNTTVYTPLPAPGPTGTVTISLKEYDHLVELASTKTGTPDSVPIPFVLSHAIFKFRVADQKLTGTVEIDGSLLEKGAVKTPLTTGLTVLEAKQADHPLPLLLEGPNHAAILNGPGPFAVSLGIAYPLTIEAGRAAFILHVPLASSAILQLELPGSHAGVELEPGLVTSRTTAGGTTLIEAALEPGKPTRVSWGTREIAAPVAQREVRFLSDIKQVISVGDSQLRLTALCDVTLVQGEASEFKLPLPAGFELTAVSGTTLESSEVSGNMLTLRVHDPARRTHQFLIALERANRETKVAAPLLELSGAQRETGEVLVEGVGSMELMAKESGGLRRMDVREAGAITRSLSHFPLQAAFRYNRRAVDAPKLQLDWQQFLDADVLPAVAERATVTTLANVEGRTLTEVTLRIRNHAQQFIKVELPPGAQLFTAEVEGQRVKPVEGSDGSRVPLLRPGLDSSKAYTVSFVYFRAGSRFGKKGSYSMELPKLDIPVNILSWEVSLPDRLELKHFGGNALSAELFPPAVQTSLIGGFEAEEFEENLWASKDLSSLAPGHIGGIVTDFSGAVVAKAEITLSNTQTGRTITTTSDTEGHWLISDMEPGPIRVRVTSSGFKAKMYEVELQANKPARIGTTLEVGSIQETVNITDGASTLNSEGMRLEGLVRQSQVAQLNAPSQNVFNLQRRVAGILPVRVDVPRSGKSYYFVRPLVLEEETQITFQYKLR